MKGLLMRVRYLFPKCGREGCKKLMGEKVIDYTKSDTLTTIPAGSIDFLFDTIGLR